MKKLLMLLVVISITFCVFAQSPQKMSYQCVIRNSGGGLVTNQSVGIKISILQGSPIGIMVYQEIFTPNPQTNANGLVSIEIGGGLPLTGTFSAVNWASGPYFLKTETDPTGGTTYTISGTSQLLSVPYALYSKTTESIPDNSITSAKIADETITAADIQDRQRNIVFPANALNYDKAATILTQSGSGIIWESNYASAAFMMIPKPLDWDETSNVTLKLYFMTITNLGGVVAFFIRPRSFNSGDTFADASSLNPVSNVTIPASSQYKVYEQSFTIPSIRFGTKSLWIVSIQREGTGETYTDSLILMAVEIIYTAEQ
jgi:hypothetical protein